MKDSSEWIRQPKVDKASDEVVAERDCHISEVKPNWVAKKLGVELNGALSEKVFDWRRRRLAESTTLGIAVPVHAETEFREHFEQLGRDAVATFRRTVGTIGSELDRAATLRVNDAERRRDQAEADRDDVLVLCRKAEAQCATLEAHVADLQQQLEEARRGHERLLGRLEQRDQDARAERPPVEEAPVDKVHSDMVTLADALVNGPPEDVDKGAAAPAAPTTGNVDPAAAANAVTEQPPAIATPPTSGGQVGLPIVGDADANTADSGDDDRG